MYVHWSFVACSSPNGDGSLPAEFHFAFSALLVASSITALRLLALFTSVVSGGSEKGLWSFGSSMIVAMGRPRFQWCEEEVWHRERVSGIDVFLSDVDFLR